MSLISIPFTFTVGAVIVASQHNSNFITIYSDYNGNITDANIASNAAIADTKLGQITTAGKVSGAALTSLSSIPSGAGLIPVANIDTGTTANKIVILNGSSKLPAVDGSQLTSVTVSGLLGDPVTKTDSVDYTATTDGFAICQVNNGGGTSSANVYTGASANPVATGTRYFSQAALGNTAFLMIPIKKGNHYALVVTGASNILQQFLPYGS